MYLAAFVPAENESAASLGASTHLIGSAIMSREDGATYLDPAKARAAMYGDCPADLAAWAAALLRTQNPGCGRGIPQRQAWRDTPSTYVICAKDRAIDPNLQAEMARRCRSTRTWPTGHAPFLSRPDLLIELIRELLDVVRSPRNAFGGHEEGDLHDLRLPSSAICV